MNPDERLVYQIVASRRGQGESDALRARLDYRPLLLGSGPAADLRLDSPGILPAHVRLFLTTTGQVMITNLGATDTVSLGENPLLSLVAVHWKPGIVVYIGDFVLELVTLIVEGERGELEHIRPSVVTQESEVVAQSQHLVIDEIGFADQVGREEALPPPGTETSDFPNEQGQSGTFLFAEEVGPVTETVRGAPPVTFLEYGDITVGTPTMSFGADLPEAAAPGGAAADTLREPFVAGTLPKDWRSAGLFSAQPALNPVNLVAGERVRLPVSVRNGYGHTMQLRVLVAGVPREWVILPPGPIELAPGEINAFDLVLQTQAPVEEPHLTLKLWLSDRASPDIALTLALQINFKAEPDLVGHLDRVEVDEASQAVLHLQNHTLAATQVFVAGHSGTSDVQVIPAQSQLYLPPGQVARVPVGFRVMHRPLWRPARHAFSVSAVQGHRAPLDYPGTVRVRARLPFWLSWLLVVGVLVIGALVTVGLARQTGPFRPAAGGTPGAGPTDTPAAPVREAATPTALVSEGPSQTPVPPTPSRAAAAPTATTEGSATPGASSTPLPTPTVAPSLAFEDPRPAGCAISIPPGWQPYAVQRGDTVFRLAVNSGAAVDEIMRINCLQDPRRLQIGQMLLLPGP